MKVRKVIVVGGGASGLMAAISAAREGAEVTLLEQRDRVGKKILSTGNGRCNFTNEDMQSAHFRGENTELVSAVLAEFGTKDAVDFFAGLGVLSKSRNGYLYPISDQASTILDALRLELARLHVHSICETKVTEVIPQKNGFLVKTQNEAFSGDAVILATGGKAAPILGSDGSGYALAKAFGHTLSPVVPALVQLKCKGQFFKSLAGVRTNASVRLYVDGHLCAEDTGELQLTDYGISGIPVFQVSRYASKALYEKKAVRAEINFLPTMSEEALLRYIKQRMESLGERSAEDFLLGMFHKKVLAVLLKQAGISPTKQANTLQEKEVKTLCELCRHFSVEVMGTNSFEQAQICAGGVRTSEVNPQTMESVYAKNLYLTGELLDIDGICGGYNLHWAWASGYLAGKNAAKG